MTKLMLSPLNGEIALLWKELSVFKPSFSKKLAQYNGKNCEHLITDCLTGFVKFGEMTAILGPSGAGKTSLLRCLYGISNLEYLGEIFMNISSKGAVFINQNEDDHLLTSLTVEESLYYSSRLKCSRVCDTSRVNSLILQLGLVPCRTNLVKHCSGGQKKRLAIAQELTGDEMPGIVLMDEPTSGLDSKASHVLIFYLQQLCQAYQIALVTTIHQPSYTLLRLFNNIYVMSLSGHFLFYGNPDDIPFCLGEVDTKIPDGCNPADILLDAASITESSEIEPFEDDDISDEDSYDTIVSLNTAKKLENYTKKRIEQEIQKHKLHNMSKVDRLFENEKTVSIEHVKLLMRRMVTSDILRDPTAQLVKILVHILTGLMVVYFYDHPGANEDGCVPAVENLRALNCQYKRLTSSKKFGLSMNENFIFYNFFLLTLTSLVSSIMSFTSDLKVFINEHRNGWYATNSHFIARNILEILYQIPLPYLYFLLISFSAQQFELHSFGDAIPFMQRSHFKDLAMIGILATIVTQGIGFSISTLFTRSTAFYLGFSFFMANFVVSNFFVQFEKGTFTSYISYLTVIRWMIEGSVAALYGDRCHSTDPERFNDMLQNVLNSLNKSSIPPMFQSAIRAELSRNYTNIRSKSMIYDTFQMDEHSIYFYYLVLLAMLVFWRLIALILLKIRVKSKSLFIE